MTRGRPPRELDRRFRGGRGAEGGRGYAARPTATRAGCNRGWEETRRRQRSRRNRKQQGLKDRLRARAAHRSIWRCCPVRRDSCIAARTGNDVSWSFHKARRVPSAEHRALPLPIPKSAVRVWPGNPYPLGATYDGAGTNFSVFSELAERLEICLFDEHGNQTCVDLPEM